MDVELLVVPDCPHESGTRSVLRFAFERAGLTGQSIRTTMIASWEQAQERGFVGSPTILIDGVDPFGVAGQSPAVACRVYVTPAGLSGVPPLGDVVAALGTALDRDLGCRQPGASCPPTEVAPGAVARGAVWLRAARHAKALAWFSLAWMTAEGVLGLVAGVAANSIALIGWALGSVIEGLASVIVLWRFTGSRTVSETSERRAQRAIAISFFLLAPYLGVESVRDLAGGHQITPNILGVVVTAASLVVMPLLGRAKQRLGERLDSGATTGEGIQNYLCAAQAGAVLLGLAATAAFGWTWLDPVIGLFLAGWAVYEGVEAWRGEDCC